MKTFKTKTGFGYIKDKQDNIISKCSLPKGEHPIQLDYEFIEVKSEKELNTIEIKAPEISKEDILEQKIRAEIRRLAIESLKARKEI